MHHLGYTRSAYRRDHLLQTPDTFIRTSLPGLIGGQAVLHAGPSNGAAFTQYTVEFEPGGTLAANPHQRFVFVLEGQLALHTEGRMDVLTPAACAYIPAGLQHNLSAPRAARAAVIERATPAGDGPGCPLLISHEDAVPSAPLQGDPDLQVRTLLPDHPGLNFAVNTMTYQPGASLAQVEIHIMEHGLLMLEGTGIYRLGEHWYPVSAGDFIWMASFCPQWFGALGKRPAKYLIYKDWNQHPLG